MVAFDRFERHAPWVATVEWVQRLFANERWFSRPVLKRATARLYERGEELRKACQSRLDAAQARIEKIVAGTDGKPAGTQPFDADGNA